MHRDWQHSSRVSLLDCVLQNLRKKRAKQGSQGMLGQLVRRPRPHREMCGGCTSSIAAGVPRAGWRGYRDLLQCRQGSLWHSGRVAKVACLHRLCSFAAQGMHRHYLHVLTLPLLLGNESGKGSCMLHQVLVVLPACLGIGGIHQFS
jgi:hypothetical protein